VLEKVAKIPTRLQRSERNKGSATSTTVSLMQKIAYVGLAGLFGTLVRYWLSGWVDQRVGETFPTGTLVVNLAGCFLAGFLYQLFEGRFLVDPAVRAAILLGFLGGFTTFSSFGVQTFALLRDGEYAFAAVNIVISNVGGLALVWAGYVFSKLW
jgi:CrcB protein